MQSPLELISPNPFHFCTLSVHVAVRHMQKSWTQDMEGRAAALREVLPGLEKLSLPCPPQKDGFDTARSICVSEIRAEWIREPGRTRAKHGEIPLSALMPLERMSAGTTLNNSEL